ncbi:MAG TPA: disulfide bond formation protein B [Rhodopila sp.]|nr:disulfide bond formation protein B [Rhodopila sp.]
MRTYPPRTLAVCLALAAAAALGIALASETWGGLVPCALCLVERWPYRILIVIGLVAAIAPRRLVRPFLSLSILALLASLTLAIIHVGVEQGFWPSPLPECAAPHITGASIAERLATLPARPSKPCDSPTFLIPGLPLSMASMNLLFSLILLGIIAALLPARPHRR